MKKCRTGFLTAGRVTNNLNFKTMNSKKKTAEKVTAKVENTAAQVDAVNVDTTAPQVATENAVSVESTESTESVQTLKNVSFRVGDSLTTTKGESLRVESVESRKETGQSALYHCLINGESVALTSTQIKKRCGYIIDGRTNSPRATKISDIPTLFSEYCKTLETLRTELDAKISELTEKFTAKANNAQKRYGLTATGFDAVSVDEFTAIQTERIQTAQAESESNRANRKAEKVATTATATEKAALLNALLANMTDDEKRALLGA